MKRGRQALKERWDSDAGQSFVKELSRKGYSGNGYDVSESPFGKVPESGLLDFRGIVFEEGVELRRVRIHHANFEWASIPNSWLEKCEFINVAFTKASLPYVTERGCTFQKCNFLWTNFREGVLGYLGSQLSDCRFEEVDFADVGSIRSEFNRCSFVNCDFNGLDFNAASFESCEFTGQVRQVWFRGGFPLVSDEEEWGKPRANQMKAVSFRKAKLYDVTFSDGCDLSTVLLPDDGRHAFFDRWKERLDHFLEKIHNASTPWQKEAEIFAKSCLTHAEHQRMYILNFDDLVEECGSEAANAIWDGLHAA